MDHAVRQRQFAFRRAEPLIGARCFAGDHQRGRIGEADILARHPDQPPRQEERVFAAFEHPREPVECRIRI